MFRSDIANFKHKHTTDDFYMRLVLTNRILGRFCRLRSKSVLLSQRMPCDVVYACKLILESVTPRLCFVQKIWWRCTSRCRGSE